MNKRTRYTVFGVGIALEALSLVLLTTGQPYRIWVWPFAVGFALANVAIYAEAVK